MIDAEELANRLEGTNFVENYFICSFKIDFNSNGIVFKRNIKPTLASISSNNIGHDCWLNKRITIIVDGKEIKYLGKERYPRKDSAFLYFFETYHEADEYYKKLVNSSLDLIEDYENNLRKYNLILLRLL
jgi:hypothetical protein